MDSLFRTFMSVKEVHFQADDDFTDRLSRKYTSGLLIIFASIVSMRQYFGDSIHCWCQENCSGNHEHYANMICWVSNTYYIPFSDRLPQPEEPREHVIAYYQWTPVIFIMLSTMFVIPWALWKALNRRAGIDISIIIQGALESQRAHYADIRERSMSYSVHLLRRYLMAHRNDYIGCCGRARKAMSRMCVCCAGRFSGNYLAFTYIFIKLLYLINVVAQFFLLDMLLANEYHFYGIRALSHFLLGTELIAAHNFPRETLCDYKVRQMTNVHTYTVQCVLPINLFNEKVFALLWFWLVFVACMTTFNFISWLLRCLYWPQQYYFVKRQLRAMEVSQRNAAAMKKFAVSYLRRDGLFILRLISKNAGDLVAAEMLVSLWESFLPTTQPRRLESVDNSDVKSAVSAFNNNSALKNIGQNLDDV